MVIHLRSVRTGQLLELLTQHTAPVSCLAFNGTGKLVRLPVVEWTAGVWDFLDTHSSIGLECRGEVTDLAIASNGDTLCISTSTDRLVFYASKTGDSFARGGKPLAGSGRRRPRCGTSAAAVRTFCAFIR
jgi:periodic tryptophan protein 2